jgi:hypothetical protein
MRRQLVLIIPLLAAMVSVLSVAESNPITVIEDKVIPTLRNKKDFS